MPKKKTPEPLYKSCPEAFPSLREGLKGPLERFTVATAVELAKFARKVLEVNRSARPELAIDILLDPDGLGELDDLSSINIRLSVNRPGHYTVDFGGVHDLEIFDEATMDSFAGKIQQAVDAEWTVRENTDRGTH